MAKNTVSIVVDGMVKHGILERNINPENRRQTIISLTTYARSLQNKYEAVSQQMNTLFYQGFSEKEQMYYPLGVTDPDYCVFKFTAQKGRHYRNLKSESFSLS